MNQSSVIFFFIFAAYFVFITVRGELPIYMGLLLASPKQAPAKVGDTGDAGTYVKTGIQAAELATLF